MTFSDVSSAEGEPVSPNDRESDDVLDVAGAARFLKMSEDWVYKESAAGRIPCSKFGRKLRFVRSELLEWAKKQKGTH